MEVLPEQARSDAWCFYYSNSAILDAVAVGIKEAAKYPA